MCNVAGNVYDMDLPEIEAAALRAQMDNFLQDQPGRELSVDLDHGRTMWASCEALTSGKYKFYYLYYLSPQKHTPYQICLTAGSLKHYSISDNGDG